MINPKEIAFIAEHLIERAETIATAESVTAGLLMSNFSLAKNATQFLQGGITAYNLGQKTRQLNVDPIHAEGVNCVSEKVAQQMALNVAKKFCSTWGIGVTGYAVPVPALKIKTCFVFYSFAHNDKIVLSGKIETKKRGQANVQMFFVEKILGALNDLLKSKEEETRL